MVRDCTDFCFHSYFSYMDELRDKEPEAGKPVDFEYVSLSLFPVYLIFLFPEAYISLFCCSLLKLPGCMMVWIISVIVDVPIITALALVKSPYMLMKGWQRLIEDLIGREGPFLETVCVPFAGFAIILWPLAVIGAVLCALLCSFFLGSYSTVVTYQVFRYSA